jgi:hypothetical protein
MAAFLRNLGQTAFADLKRQETIDLMVVGMGTAWFVFGVRTWMGLSEETLTNSTYARRYIGKYKKLYAEQQAHHGGAAHDAAH